jgi:hypothetical protein
MIPTAVGLWSMAFTTMCSPSARAPKSNREPHIPVSLPDANNLREIGGKSSRSVGSSRSCDAADRWAGDARAGPPIRCGSRISNRSPETPPPTGGVCDRARGQIDSRQFEYQARRFGSTVIVARSAAGNAKWQLEMLRGHCAPGVECRSNETQRDECKDESWRHPASPW